jgi:urea transport system permease protein
MEPLYQIASDPQAPAPLGATARAAIKRIERWGLFTQGIEIAFQGLSLSSILLLMALGLAIVFGLMGVINMAHGELMALGAYSTFLMQGWFTAYFPSHFDYYFLVALPFSFLVSAAAGVVLERGVIRHLYGRPLETLLLTWGVSLMIQQGLRLWFGAANVDVTSPRWLSGGVPVMIGVQLPYNRLFIIGLAAVAVGAMYLLLFRTDAGLRIRAVTQNRGMAACLGVRARWVDAGTFALGAGLAGLAGCAITQIGNVGPELGQNYIVDSFMVVVTGGVGKLLGSILAAIGIGGLNKVIEPGMGAVFGKVLILVLVILFIQRRPSGLFATKGRYAES